MGKVLPCAICGKLFEMNGFREVCPACLEKDIKDFDSIRDYLYVHPRAKVFEVSNNLDIPVPVIKRYLKEGRLEIIEKNNLFLKCEKCGKPICSGTQCSDCLKHATHDYAATFVGGVPKKAKISFLASGKK